MTDDSLDVRTAHEAPRDGDGSVGDADERDAAPSRCDDDTDGRVANDRLRDAAQALAAIVNSSRDAVIAKTVDGIISTWNDGATLVYGHRADEMIGRSFESMVPPEGLEAERARHARVAAGAAESGYRCVRLRSNGGRVEVVMSMSPIRDDTGAITGVASISRPISATERDEARFASLLEAAPDAIVCIDARGTIVTINAQVTKMFGYDREELVGTDVEVLLPEELRSGHVGLRSAFLLDPKLRAMGVGLSLRGRRRNGSVFPIEVSLAPDHGRDETIVIAVVRDMTDQRKLERDAVESANRLRQLAESTDTVFILSQLDPPDVLYVSPSARSVLGHEPSEWMDGKQALTVHPLDRDWVERAHATAAMAGHAAQSEYRLIKPDGATQWVRVVSTPVVNADGPQNRSVVTIEDITERVKAAEALQQAEAAAVEANQAKNLFLSRMSHELRTPLNAVLGFGQLLEMRFPDGDDAEAVRQILKGGRHLLGLINDVLDIARIEAGETSTSIETVSVASVVGETVELMATMADVAGVTLTVATHSTELLVLADRRRLRQMLLNLLSNAVKYNRRGGNVWVDHEVSGNQVVVTVHDDGPGIPPELQLRLFTPFDRLGAEASGVEGTGIGLALTRSLAELMSGTLTVDSVPGRGSSFTVTLPQAQATANDHSPRKDTELAFPGRVLLAGSRTLLYVEDNEPNVRVVEHILKLRPEWRLLHAGLGGLGVDLARATLPDLILLDLHLPDVSGADVLQKLKHDPTTNALPVVILTADATTGQSRRLLDMGAASYLTKPLDVADLLVLLDQTSALALKDAHV